MGCVEASTVTSAAAVLRATNVSETLSNLQWVLPVSTRENKTHKKDAQRSGVMLHTTLYQYLSYISQQLCTTSYPECTILKVCKARGLWSPLVRVCGYSKLHYLTVVQNPISDSVAVVISISSHHYMSLTVTNQTASYSSVSELQDECSFLSLGTIIISILHKAHLLDLFIDFAHLSQSSPADGVCSLLFLSITVLIMVA